MEALQTIMNLIFSLIVIFCLMIISFRIMNKGINKGTSKKYIKIIEKTQLSKESFIVVMRTGDEGMVLLTSSGHTEKLKDLTKEEVEKLERDKEEAFKEIDKVYGNIVTASKDKINSLVSKIKAKEDNHHEKS